MCYHWSNELSAQRIAVTRWQKPLCPLVCLARRNRGYQGHRGYRTHGTGQFIQRGVVPGHRRIQDRLGSGLSHLSRERWTEDYRLARWREQEGGAAGYRMALLHSQPGGLTGATGLLADDIVPGGPLVD